MKYILLFLLILLTISCAGKLIKFDQYSVAMNLEIEADSSIFIGEDDKFTGILFLQPIMEKEKIKMKKIKLIKNYGKYYLCAENFKNVWMIEPKDDGLTASYKAIDVTPENKEDRYKDIGFSRYGTKDNVCVKFNFNNQNIFIDKKGKVNEECN
jgi:hypothetical protein